MTDLRNVAIAAWLLCWIGSISAFLLSANAGYVDWCMPHLTGCDSISASGRHGWGFFVFKATMLPAAGLLLVYWVLCYRWLTALVPPGQPQPGSDRAIFTLGFVGTLFLILYVTFLGSDGDVYRTLRRYGTIIYFGFTYLAQVLMARRLVALAVDPPVVRWKVRLAVFMLVTGLTFAIAANLVADSDPLQNISEWNCASALSSFPLLTWLVWRRTGVRWRVQID